MMFVAWLRCLRVADGGAEPVQAVSFQPVACPLLGLAGPQVPAALADQDAREVPCDVPVGLDELAGSVAGAEVVAPAGAGPG